MRLAVEALAASGRKVLMVGDGLNDAAALARAHAAMAPGSALETNQNAADLVFSGDRLMDVAEAIDLARKRPPATPPASWWTRGPAALKMSGWSLSPRGLRGRPSS